MGLNKLLQYALTPVARPALFQKDSLPQSTHNNPEASKQPRHPSLKANISLSSDDMTHNLEISKTMALEQNTLPKTKPKI